MDVIFEHVEYLRIGGRIITVYRPVPVTVVGRPPTRRKRKPRRK